MMSSQLIDTIANIFFLSFVAGIPLYGYFRKVKVYDAFVDGAKDGFHVIIKIIPFLVGMLVAIGMFRASGAFDMLANACTPLLSWLGMPADILPLALIRPFSGAASNGILANIIQTHGGNSYISH